MIQQPQSLKDIKLSSWIGYQNIYGQALDDRLTSIMKMPEGDDRENEYLLYNVDYHQQNYAYYTGVQLAEVKDMDVKEVCQVQGAAFIALKKEEVLLDYNRTFEWNDSIWKIQPVYPKTDKLTKEQYDIVTDIALIFSDLQDGKHEALYELCAAYLRHPEEKYTNQLLEERKIIMKDLPFDIALCVKKYIDASIKQFLKS